MIKHIIIIVTAVYVIGKAAVSMFEMNEKNQSTMRFLLIITIINTVFVIVQEILGMYILVKIYKCRLRRLLPQEVQEILITFREHEFILNHPNGQKRIPYLKVYVDDNTLYIGGGLFPLSRKNLSEDDWAKTIQFLSIHNIV